MNIELTPGAERDLRKLPPDVRTRLAERLRQIHDPRQECPLLQGLPKALRGLRKLRVGEYRILLWFEDLRDALVVYAAAHRREIYRRLR